MLLSLPLLPPCHEWSSCEFEDIIHDEGSTLLWTNFSFAMYLHVPGLQTTLLHNAHTLTLRKRNAFEIGYPGLPPETLGSHADLPAVLCTYLPLPFRDR